MGSNTKIFLNPHAKTQQVFEVILKVMGNDCVQIVQMVYPGKKVDKSIPASDGNSWKIKFSKNEENKIISPPQPSIYFNFNFQDILGRKYSVMYFYEGYTNQLSSETDKQLNPDSNPVWAAIGKRLVDVFGGKMLYNDSSDSDDKNNWYICENPKFPKMMNEQSENDRWYQYQNLIFNEPMLTSQEIKDMKPYTRYDSDEVNELINYLEKYEYAAQLSQELDNGIKKNKTIKLKV